LEEIKIKPLTIEQLTISTDRLTRFKNTEVKYLRVFKDIIISNLIFPKFKKQDLDELDYEILKNLAEQIINTSIKSLGVNEPCRGIINQKLYDYEKSVFKVSPECEKLLKNQINYNGFIKLMPDTEVKNLLWLKELENCKDIKNTRKEKSLHFPVEKIIICEGITEETLLPVFAKIMDYDFEKNGIHIISAGGKNQVVKTYYQLSEQLRLPIFVLLDKDAEENLYSVRAKLRPTDTCYILNSGEFEDMLPLNLIKRTIEYASQSLSLLDLEHLDSNLPMVKQLEEVFRTRGLHEFKKAEFANFLKENIKDKNDLSEEIIEIINIISEQTVINK